jgi:nuclear transcription factor Y gamma
MKLDDDVKMISAEVPILFAKAAELFIQELTIHSWLQTEESRRRTLQRNDVAAAISKNELFDFLIDIVPREEATKTHKKKDQVSEVQYIVTLPTATGMGNTIQLPSISFRN